MTREVFASAPDDVLVVRLTADRPGQIDARFRLSRWQDAAAQPAVEGRLALRGQIRSLEDGSGENRGLRFEACARVLAEGGSTQAQGEAVRVGEANAVTVLVSGATSFREKDPTNACRAQLDRAAAKSYAQLREAHLQHHRALFGRVKLELGPAPAPRVGRSARLRHRPAARGACARARTTCRSWPSTSRWGATC